MVFYLYRFLDKDGNVIYIGRTNDIKRRILNEHFTDNTHLPDKCYLETEKVEYVELHNESEEVAYEAILISKSSPKYNTQFKDEGEFEIVLPELKWKNFEWEYEGQFEWLKSKKMNTIDFSDLLKNLINRPKYNKIITGIQEVDVKMPILQQSFTVIAGKNGIGKTEYLLNIAKSNIVNGKKVLYINLKESAEELAIRYLSLCSKIRTDKIIQEILTEEEWKLISDTTKNILDEKGKIVFYNICSNSWELDRILETIQTSDVDLIIIDDLQMIESERCNYVKDRMDFILKNIKSLSVQYSIPIIGSYEISKNKIESRLYKRPMLEDFEYDSIIRYPDNIQFLHKEDIDTNNKLEIIIAKNVFGKINIVEVYYIDEMYCNIEKS